MPQVKKEDRKQPNPDTLLTKDDLKAVALIEAQLGAGAAQKMKLVLMRERASRIIQVTPEVLQRAKLALVDGDVRRKNAWPVATVARKMILEDKALHAQLIYFVDGLLNISGGKQPSPFQCPQCDKPFFTAQSLSNHRTMAHTDKGRIVRAKADAKRKKTLRTKRHG